MVRTIFGVCFVVPPRNDVSGGGYFLVPTRRDIFFIVRKNLYKSLMRSQNAAKKL